MRSITSLVAVLAVTPFTTAAGQLTPGDFVRVRVGLPPSEERVIKGDLVEVTGSVLVLERTRLPIDSITRIEVSRASRGHGLAGGLVGLGVGLVGGFAVVPAAIEVCEGIEGACALIGAGVGGLTGLLVGIVVGDGIRTHDWEEVPLGRLHVSFAPQHRGRFGLTASVRF